MKIHLTQADVTDILVRYFYGKFDVDLKPGSGAVTAQPAARGGFAVEIKLAVEDDAS